MRKFISYGPALVVLLTALLTLIAAPAAVRKISYASTDANIVLARQELSANDVLKQINRATRAIASAVEPSVVHVAVLQGAGRGTGSGWVFDDKGHIVTNAHVIEQAQGIRVQFQDGRAMPATIVGQDRSTDIAVLRVESTEGLFAARRATGEDIQQGDRVYAFGSPFGFKFSMSEGIVSGLGRDPSADRGGFSGNMFTNYIQSDAAVNPGNSGGPLVDVEGRVIGMNVAIATAASRGSVEGQNSGISFAIPLSTIEPVVEQLITGGVVAKGYLGVSRPSSDDANARLLASMDFRGRGVFIEAVPPGGPAAKAGLEPRDIVTKINGEDVANLAGFRTMIANNQPGETIKVEVWRGGAIKTFDVTLGRLTPPLERGEVIAITGMLQRLGVELEEVRGDAMVIGTNEGSKASELGLLPRTRIVAVDGEKTEGIVGLFRQLRDARFGERAVTVTIETPRGEGRDVTLPAMR
jgi:serine protease Do